MKNQKASLLLHCCCAPCTTHPVKLLLETYDVSAFFYNPNIHPVSEYEYRKNEIQKLMKKWGVPIHIAPYESDIWFDEVKGLEDEPEGGRRCEICFRLRLEKTAYFAKKKEIDFFATTLSISPLKNAGLINTIGHAIGKEMGISYFEADFKKKDGFKIACKMSEAEGLYRQNYCGCVFSKKSSENKRFN